MRKTYINYTVQDKYQVLQVVFSHCFKI